MKPPKSSKSRQGGVASTTEWPSCSSRAAASRAASTHSAATGASIGGVVVIAIRSPPGSRPTSSANGRSGGGAHHGSPVSYPAITSRRAAASATVRVSGPLVEKPSSPPYGAGETRPRAGLIPNRPQQEAGMRIEPPPSLPWAAGARPAATAAAAPPLDPPGVASRVPRVTAGAVQLRLGHRRQARARACSSSRSRRSRPPSAGGRRPRRSRARSRRTPARRRSSGSRPSRSDP